MRKLLLFSVLVLAVNAAIAEPVIFTAYTNYNDWATATMGWNHFPFLSTPINQSQNPGTTVVTDAGAWGAPRGVFTGLYDQVWTDRVTQAGAETTTWFINSGPTQAFGGYWDFSPAGYGQGLTLTVSLLNKFGSQQVFDICGVPGCEIGVNQKYYVPDGSFFGVVADQPFLAFTISADHQAGVAETFDLAGLDMANIPEPGTMIMLGTGIVGLAGALRRKLF